MEMYALILEVMDLVLFYKRLKIKIEKMKVLKLLGNHIMPNFFPLA